MDFDDIHLTKKQKALLLYFAEHPTASFKEASEVIDISPNTVYV
jgi:DNA-binding CsgD family transcriptional regulator